MPVDFITPSSVAVQPAEDGRREREEDTLELSCTAGHALSDGAGDGCGLLETGVEVLKILIALTKNLFSFCWGDTVHFSSISPVESCVNLTLDHFVSVHSTPEMQSLKLDLHL